MARKSRTHYDGAVYHAVGRGNNREQIFKEAAAQARYLGLVAEYKLKGDALLLPAIVGVRLCRTSGAISLLEISLPESDNLLQRVIGG